MQRWMWMYVWNTALLGTTAYVVFWLDRSPWWFAGALLIYQYTKSDDCECNAESEPAKP